MPISNTHTKRALDVVGKKFVRQLKQSAQKSFKESKDLSNSIRFTPLMKKGKFGIKVWYRRYGDYHDKGVRGAVENQARDTPYAYTVKRPHSKNFIQWVQKRGINKLTKGKNAGKKISPKSAAFMIARSVWRKGLRSRQWLGRIKKTETKNVRDRIVAAFKKDVAFSIVKSYNK